MASFLHYFCRVVLLLFSVILGARAFTTAFSRKNNKSQRQRQHRADGRYSLLVSSLSVLSEFDLLQHSLYRKQMEDLQRTCVWLDSIKSLPFECTGCGKCCRTIGNVYMSPEEVEMASSYKNMKISDFIESYALKTMESTNNNNKKKNEHTGDDDPSIPWILVENQHTEQGPACIFLDSMSNQCTIYPVRPIQCSTYPFWTNILESECNWNEEVRRSDDNVDVDDEEECNYLPEWTAEDGGCEGMFLLDDSNTQTMLEGVPLKHALEQLALYKHADRRLPRDHKDFEE